MKVFREKFDPRAALLEALAEALKELSRNPDRVIRICDRLLTLDAPDEDACG